SVKSAAKVAAEGMLQYYHGNETGHEAGLIDPPYYWRIGGAMFQALIDYWYYTADSTYINLVIQGIMAQTGSGDDSSLSVKLKILEMMIKPRLAAYTGNKAYADWAEKAFDWTHNTYGSEIWKERARNISSSLNSLFFNNKGIMSEVTCEPVNTCNNDQQTFKPHTIRWMTAFIKLAPFLEDELIPVLRNSSIAAAKQCSGPNNTCGLQWTKVGDYDGITCPGEQMAALQVFMSKLVSLAKLPANFENGDSEGNPAAGTSSHKPTIKPPSTITAKDRVGAIISTVIAAATIVLATMWVMLGQA
ncbi:hydrolase 76 protein, partial [Ascosphaera aggregata]